METSYKIAIRALEERTSEYDVIQRALSKSKTIASAARKLGVSHQTLYNWLDENGYTVEKRYILVRTNGGAQS
jgi:transcriptional regulator with PAS, ATPase and Fis domain